LSVGVRISIEKNASLKKVVCPEGIKINKKMHLSKKRFARRALKSIKKMHLSKSGLPVGH